MTERIGESGRCTQIRAVRGLVTAINSNRCCNPSLMGRAYFARQGDWSESWRDKTP